MAREVIVPGRTVTYDDAGNVIGVSSNDVGLPPPAPPAPEERLATLLAALADAQTLGDVREAAQAAGGA